MDNQMESQIKEIIETMKKMLDGVKKGLLADDAVLNMISAIKDVNLFFYQSEQLEFQEQDYNDRDVFVNDMEKLIGIWNNSLSRRKKGDLERRFWKLYERFLYVKTETIVEQTVELFLSYPEEYKKEFTTIPKRYTFLNGKMDIDDQDFSLIQIYADMMKNNLEDFKWLFFELADNRSKMILIRIVEFWFDLDLYSLIDLHETVFKDYYDLDILECDENEVLVDCGAYTGDSLCDFIETYRNYKRIYAYEISPEIMEQLRKNTLEFPNVELRQCGVSDQEGIMFLNAETEGEGSNLIEESDRGKAEVKIVSLDNDIKEKITIIKMDIEGMEMKALTGAEQHIKQDKPRLLICTYHVPSDIFQIPRLIREYRDDYKLYLRYNGRGIWPCDHVLLAV